MTDRELLELAAKAAGISVWWNGRTCFLLEDGVAKYEWNPLYDDGDALRLAVTLKISIHLRPKRVEVLSWPLPKTPYGFGGTPFPKVETVEPYDDDPLAATRLAIVRAAAEIGRSMT
jgi:hypothetical protein